MEPRPRQRFCSAPCALTADPARRADRALAAAQASIQAGSFDAVLQLLATAETGPLDELQRARVNLLRGNVAFALGAATDAPSSLLEAARRLEPLDVELARETYLTAWGAAGMAGQGDVILEIWAAVRALAPTSGAPGPLELLLEGMAQLTVEGHAVAAPTLQRAADALLEMPVEDALRWGWAAIGASTAVWDDEGMRAISARLVRLVRDAGVLAAVAAASRLIGLVHLMDGDLAGVASLIAEAESVAAATGTAFAPLP